MSSASPRLQGGKTYLEKLQLDQRRYQKLAHTMVERMSPVKYKHLAEPVSTPLSFIVLFFAVVGPLVGKLLVKLYELYMVLPHNVINAIIGFGLCFMGGHFPTLIAAVEAFKMSGWDATRPHIRVLWQQHNKLLEANQRDDKKDDDRNGVADVNELPADQLLFRKARLFAATADPAVVNTAMGGVYTAFLGVLAALKIKFAKAAMLSVAVANMARPPVQKYVVPAFGVVVAPEFKQWIPIAVDYSIKVVAVSFAWWIQRIVSAVHSAIRGGRMLSSSIFLYLNEAGIIPIDPATTKADEVV
eukprot:CAMPEP_0118945676 /NCGR_PEP_ID=MMETSP1169-20130426/42736_1 /TAXON_ID=36882 /ORGANISM="Pyramimonas obovata, Strain CCMP722" /LENGTH=300 /DNA_ID=CAMNT_0006891445 /DNA_START=86 /DNA_END=984 /DNA_ORIENTATION=-